MLLKMSRWKFVFAFLAVTAFAVVTGHESVHVDDASHCQVCHVKQITPADLAAPAAAAVFAAIVFAIFISSSTRPVSSACLTLSGRSPPTRSL